MVWDGMGWEDIVIGILLLAFYYNGGMGWMIVITWGEIILQN